MSDWKQQFSNCLTQIKKQEDLVPKALTWEPEELKYSENVESWWIKITSWNIHTCYVFNFKADYYIKNHTECRCTSRCTLD